MSENKNTHKVLDMKTLNNIYRELWQNDFKTGISTEAKQQITELLSFLISIPKNVEKEFINEFLEVRYAPSMTAAILLAFMRKIELKKAEEKYWFIFDYEKSISDMYKIMKAITDAYNIKIINKSFFGKRKVRFKFPSDFYERVAIDFILLPPKEKKAFAKTGDDWEDFLEWWAILDEDTDLNTDLHLGAYMMMWYNNEVLNGGYDQFFYNKSKRWDLEKVTMLFKELLPKKEFENYLKAFDNYKNDISNEELNDFFEEDLVQDALEKLAKRIVKLI